MLFGYLIASLAKTALPVLVIVHSIVKIFMTEVRPQLFAEIKLCVCHLPQKKIADAQLPARSYQQVWVWVVSCNKIVTQCLFCHVGGPLYGPVAAGIARVGPFIDGFSVTIEVQTRLSAEVTR